MLTPISLFIIQMKNFKKAIFLIIFKEQFSRQTVKPETIGCHFSYNHIS